MLTELTFCHKLSTNISIDNWYYNPFIQLGRPIFPVKHNGAALYLQSRPHLGSRMGVSGCYTCEALVAQSATWVTTRQLDAFTVPSTHNISNNCIYLQSHLFASTDSIVIDLMTMENWRLIIFSALATSPAPPAILPFLLVGLLWLPVIALWL